MKHACAEDGVERPVASEIDGVEVIDDELDAVTAEELGDEASALDVLLAASIRRTRPVVARAASRSVWPPSQDESSRIVRGWPNQLKNVGTRWSSA